MLCVANARSVIPSIQFLNQFIKGAYNTSFAITPEKSAAIVERGTSTDSKGDLSMSLNDRIVGFDTWYAQQNAMISSSSDKRVQNQKLPTPLMDLRSESSRTKRRLVFPQEIKVVPFPIEFLKERSFELPGNSVLSPRFSFE